MTTHKDCPPDCSVQDCPLVQQAVALAASARSLHNQYTLTLPEPLVKSWEDDLLTWEGEGGSLVSNPYIPQFPATSREPIHMQLLSEAAAAQLNDGPPPPHDITASKLITMGLDLEEEQRHIAAKKKAMADETESTNFLSMLLENRARSLQHTIRAWIDVQHIYMPFLQPVRRSENTFSDPSNTPVEAIPLHLPSSTPISPLCEHRLLVIEYDLRIRQAHEALNELREVLRLRYLICRSERHNEPRQLQIIARLEAKCSLIAARYRAARSALIRLASRLGRSDQGNLFQELADGDIYGPAEQEEDSEKKSQANVQSSWIWRQVGVGEPVDASFLQEALRLEFCRRRAKCIRLEEEAEFVKEEHLRRSF